MPADGPTLIHRARLSDQGWIPAYPNMTKDCRSAVVIPTIRNNSDPGKSQMRSFVVQDTATMTPSVSGGLLPGPLSSICVCKFTDVYISLSQTTMPAPPGAHSARSHRPPPQPTVSQNSDGRPSHSLPQRPAGPHIPHSAADEVMRLLILRCVRVLTRCPCMFTGEKKRSVSESYRRALQHGRQMPPFS